MKQVNNIKDYLKIIEQISVNSLLFFRGQLEKYNGFPPTIARDPGFIVNENNIIQETTQNRINEFRDLDMPLKKLAKMQHYGIPTRLVDLTTNPLVALYFAIEDVEDKSSGNIFIFDEKGFSINSREAKFLSFIPFIADRDLNNIVLEYQKQYSETVTSKEVLNIIDRPIFIKYSKELEITNPRLCHQSGTFLICTNKFVDGKITDELISLDNFQPIEVIRIPFEYKKEIKQRLDLEFNINYINEYPELIPYADYIKSKYKISPSSKDVSYSIVGVQDVSTAAAKRKSIIMVLHDQFDIEKIKKLVMEIINKYKDGMDVIWMYVARNTDDLIVSNWILRCQWINPRLNENFRPITLEQFESECYWDFSKSYSINSDVMRSSFEDDDKALLLSHKAIWNDFLKVYTFLKNSLNEFGWDEFAQEVNLKKGEITKLYLKLQNFGHSHNKDFDDFLYEFSTCIAEIDNLHYILENASTPILGKQSLVNKAFLRSEEKISKIRAKISHWEYSLQIDD